METSATKLYSIRSNINGLSGFGVIAKVVFAFFWQNLIMWWCKLMLLPSVIDKTLPTIRVMQTLLIIHRKCEIGIGHNRLNKAHLNMLMHRNNVFALVCESIALKRVNRQNPRLFCDTTHFKHAACICSKSLPKWLRSLICEIPKFNQQTVLKERQRSE